MSPGRRGGAAVGLSSPGRGGGGGGGAAASAAAAPGTPKPSPSAVHTVAGIGLRFTTVGTRGSLSGTPSAAGLGLAGTVAGLPDPIRTCWGGSASDVLLAFPVPSDPTAALYVDSYAYIPPPSATTALSHALELGETGGSKKGGAGHGASQQLQNSLPGSELTSCDEEKAFGRVVEWLLRSGCPMDAADKDGVTALMLCARYGLLYLLRKLLARRSDYNAKDKWGNTCLHYAYAFRQGVAAGIIEEFAGFSLAEVPNAGGQTALQVIGLGMGVAALGCSERLVTVPKPPKKSSSLTASSAS